MNGGIIGWSSPANLGLLLRNNPNLSLSGGNFSGGDDLSPVGSNGDDRNFHGDQISVDANTLSWIGTLL